MVKRGDIILVDLEPVRGFEQGLMRPVLVIQNNVSNKFSSTIIISAITSRKFTKEFPTNVEISMRESGLNKDSTILLNQIRTIDKLRIIKKLGFLNERVMHKVGLAIKISLDLD